MPSRFDPRPDQPYGKCLDCDMTLQTEEASHAHQNAVLAAAKPDAHGMRSGHSVRILNASRSQKICMEVRTKVGIAIDDLMTIFSSWVEAGDATTQEIATALSQYSDFSDAWEEHLDE